MTDETKDAKPSEEEEKTEDSEGTEEASDEQSEDAQEQAEDSDDEAAEDSEDEADEGSEDEADEGSEDEAAEDSADEAAEDSDAEEEATADAEEGDAEDDESDDEDAEEADAEDSDEEDDEDEAPEGLRNAHLETEELERDELETMHADRGGVAGVIAVFDHPAHLMYAAEQTRDSDYQEFDAFSPFPVHGMDEAMGMGRSWIPWVTFGAGCTGFSIAVIMEFGIMGYEWPMIFGGKPFLAWPGFVPIMFELTVLLAGCTTALIMLIAAGCFRRNRILHPEITKDRFVLWISAEDEHFDLDEVIGFMKDLNPMEIQAIREDA